MAKELLSLFLCISVFRTSVSATECQALGFDCNLDCPYGLQRDASGCEICLCLERQCLDMYCAPGKICRVYKAASPNPTEEGIASCIDPRVPELCWGPVETGRCRASMVRWYYDHDMGDCLQFMYGGCGGNTNNFLTREKCVGTCTAGISGERINCAYPPCTLLCQNGYLKDDQGCSLCQCANLNDQYPGPRSRAEFQVEPGCEGDEEAFCDLHCENGFQMDSNGCTVCACVSPGSCPLLVNCEMYCPHGMRLNSQGCEICECRLPGECPDVSCSDSCPFGRQVDENGCERCMCRQDPCYSMECPRGTICKSTNTSAGFAAKCITESSYNNPGCRETQCRMFCEYGFITDRRGCEKCECRQNYTECAQERCDYCPYGFVYNENGCRTCTCLVDPCMAKICGDGEACVAVRYRHCDECNPYPVCVGSETIRRMHLHMEYSYETEEEEINHEDIKTEMKKQMTELMAVPEEDIVLIEVESAELESHIRVHYHVLKSEETDVVQLYKSYRDRLLRKNPSHYSLTVDGVVFTPRTESLMASYSQDAEMPNIDASTEESGVAAIVVGCVVAVVLVALLIAVIGIAVYKKKKEKEQPRKNIIYKKSVTSEIA